MKYQYFDKLIEVLKAKFRFRYENELVKVKMNTHPLHAMLSTYPRNPLLWKNWTH